MSGIAEMRAEEIEYVGGAGLPVVFVVARIVYAAATSTTGKAVFAGAAAIAGGVAAGVFEDSDSKDK